MIDRNNASMREAESFENEPPILPYVVVAILGMLNWSAFHTIAGWIGGTALQGHQGGGHWYLTVREKFKPPVDHEVSQALYVYSLVHGYAAMVGFAVALICLIIAGIRIRAIFRSGENAENEKS